MTRGEIALQLTLLMIEKGYLTIEDRSPNGVGESVSELYNAISENIKPRGKDED